MKSRVVDENITEKGPKKTIAVGHIIVQKVVRLSLISLTFQFKKVTKESYPVIFKSLSRGVICSF